MKYHRFNGDLMKRNNELAWSALAFALVASLTAIALYGVVGQVPLVSAATNSIGANVAVPNTCIPLASNTAIIWGGTTSIGAGSYAPTSNAVTVTNFGNYASNIFVFGNDLTYLANVIAVSNVLWNPTSGANIGNALTSAVTGTDTKIVTAANDGTNTIYFGVNVPASALPGPYTGNINVMLSC